MALLLYTYCLITEVLIHLKNTTAILGGKGHFFCQVQAEVHKVRFDGELYSIPNNAPKDITVDAESLRAQQNALRIINVTITIEASIERNNTLVECQTKDDGSRATLIVHGRLLHDILIRLLH